MKLGLFKNNERVNIVDNKGGNNEVNCGYVGITQKGSFLMSF